MQSILRTNKTTLTKNTSIVGVSTKNAYYQLLFYKDWLVACEEISKKGKPEVFYIDSFWGESMNTAHARKLFFNGANTKQQRMLKPIYRRMN